MLRVTIIAQNATQTVLALDGWLTGEEVRLLEHEGRRWLDQGHQLVLDLDGVRSIDQAGMALLEGWSRTGVLLRGGSLYVRALLQSRGLSPQPEPPDAGSCAGQGHRP